MAHLQRARQAQEWAGPSADDLASVVIDEHGPSGVDAAGRRFRTARSRIWFQLDCGQATLRPAGRAKEMPDDDMPEDMPEEMPEEGWLIGGVASSTSVDSYGTEMSAECLEDMAEQMRAGVAYVPTHWTSEWNDVIGRTVDAQVERTDVVAPADPKEQGHALRCTARLDPHEELGCKLGEKIKGGATIGQSIAGWFTELRFIDDDEGDVDRIIVEKMELDHLAATRSPACPDAWIETLRSKVRSTMAARSGTAGTPPVERSATPFADLPIDKDHDTKWTWDAAAQDAILGDPPDWALYRKAHLWYDPDDKEAKSGYKLPIALMQDGKLTVIWHGLVAAMGAINGARGGVDIPDDQRKKAYDHAKKYYDKFGEDCPDFVEKMSAPTPAPNPIPARGGPATGDDVPLDSERATPHGDIDTMTPEEIAAMLRTTLQAELAPLTERLSTVEQRVAAPPAPAPAAVPTDPRDIELARLRATNASLAATVDRALSTPNRRAVHPLATAAMRPDETGVNRAAQRLAITAEGDGYHALSRFVAGNAPIIERALAQAAEPEAINAATDFAARARNAEGKLKTFFRALEGDGIINPPADPAHGWT